MNDIAFSNLLNKIQANDPSLTILDIRHMEQLGRAQFKALMDALKYNTMVTTIDCFCCTYLQDEGVAMIADMLRVNQSIKRVELDNVQMTHLGLIELCKALENNTQVEFLNIRANPMVPFGTKASSAEKISSQVAEAFANLLRHNQSINNLQMDGMALNDTIFKGIGAGLAVNTGLKQLNLGGWANYSQTNSIHGLAALQAALVENKTIIQLRWHLEINQTWPMSDLDTLVLHAQKLDSEVVNLASLLLKVQELEHNISVSVRHNWVRKTASSAYNTVKTLFTCRFEEPVEAELSDDPQAIFEPESSHRK